MPDGDDCICGRSDAVTRNLVLLCCTWTVADNLSEGKNARIEMATNYVGVSVFLDALFFQQAGHYVRQPK